jgi:phosphate starvation-inducible protein PhoH and related proteins
MARTKKKPSAVTEIQSSGAFHIQPMNEKQSALLDAIHKNTMTVAIGTAGTGKTYCSASKVAQLFLRGGYDKIVLTRPNVSTGRSVGFFPGTVEEKLSVWLQPLLTVLKEAFGAGRYQYFMEKGIIQIQPLETVRGQSFNDALILIDECQNLEWGEIEALTTRIGENSKMVLMGDPRQSDVKNGMAIERFIKMAHNYKIDVPVIRFGLDDVVRSDIVAQLVKAFYYEG